MTKINNQTYDAGYLKSIKDVAFKRMDNAGTKDGKISVEEAYKDLDIGFMLEGQNATDTFKIASSTSDIPEVLKKYAGKDGEFSAKEWANFLNGDEWGEALEAWHSSEKMAELEKDWAEAENLYYQEIEDVAFKRMDAYGNKDGKITIDEALADLDIASLLEDQSAIDTIKIFSSASKIPEALEKYAGGDGEFSAKEWASFLNGDEWGEVLDAWHSSSGKAKLEMQWIDDAGIKDNKTTKGEIKVGIFGSLNANNIDVDTRDIEKLIDKYAGEDGVFNKKEYMALNQDSTYKAFMEKYNVEPWFRFEDK